MPGTLSDPAVAWLLADRNRYRARCKLTLDDIRAAGVTSSQILAYMWSTEWEPTTPDVGDCYPIPTDWRHPRFGILRLWTDTRTITDLAKLEKRSPWLVLDDCARHAPPQPLYLDGALVAHMRGPEFLPLATTPAEQS